MSQFLRRQRSDNRGRDVDERVDQTSPDLAYELQSKMFDQLATVGIAGAGLAVTLIGSTLRNAPNDVWLSVVFFGIAAVTAISGNQKLVDSVSRRQPSLQRSRLNMQLATLLVGAAIGWLSMSVYSEGARQKPSLENVVAKQ
ncbi:MAG: hypothetical protein H7Y19_11545 [Luteimonas sp.]|nr:hypothetical protein [Luteimonas sp.]